MVFVLACCLFSGDSYAETARKAASWLERAAGVAGWRVPGAPALARARRRLGVRPFELLFARLAGPLTGTGVPGAAAFGLLLAALDGSTLEVPYTPANVAAFGSPPSGHRTGGYPQVRLVTVTGCGSRGLVAAAFAPGRGKGGGEGTLACRIAGGGILGPGMLVLADRVFCGYPVVSAITATGADVLIRAKSERDQHLPCDQALTDGSWLSVLPDPAAGRLRAARAHARRRRGSTLADTSPLPGITVRVIEFTPTVTSSDGSCRSEPYRLITTLLDPAQAPARQVAACYAQRWEIETSYRELKTTLRGPGRILRSRDPAMIGQEIWALLCACQLIQATRAAAAHAGGGLDPDRISFTVTLRALRRQITAGHHRYSRHAVIPEILSQLLPPRRRRSFPRLTQVGTATRRNARAPHHGPVIYTITITTLPSTSSQPGP